MIFSRLWIIPRVVFIIFFLMADLIFNCGVSLASGHHLQSKGNSSTGSGTRIFEANVLNDFLKSVLIKSKALEEVIYSDVLNNLRNLVKSENYQSVESGKKKCKTHDVTGKNREVECEATDARAPVNSGKTEVLPGGSGRVSSAAGGREGPANSTLGPTSLPEEKEKYLLGYSGNPFGGRQPIFGAVEVPRIDPLGTDVADPRRKRSVLHLYNMVLCTTGCNPFAYKGYGCYCGFLGSGFVVDGIDSCCKMHDWCYNSAGCPMFLEYFIPYLWQCHHRQPVCAIDHGYYGGPGSCAQRLCECDRQLALCLRRYPCPSTKALCTSSPWRLLQNVLML